MRIHKVFLNSSMFNKHLKKKKKSPYISYPRCVGVSPLCPHPPVLWGPGSLNLLIHFICGLWLTHSQPGAAPRGWAGNTSATGPQATLTGKRTGFHPSALNTLLSK